MSDLEWYLDVGGKQSGPHTAKEIVEMVRAGKIPASSQVTAARMNGDWVRAQDLIEAYDELYSKPALATPIEPAPSAPFTATITNPSVVDPNFSAPPRPTEQLEKSKIITLNREELDRTPDPTEALFQAIQAAREKANQKSGGATTRDPFGGLNRPSGPRVPPQLLLILTLAAIFGLTVYGFTRLVGGKNAEEAAKGPASRKNVSNPDSQPAVHPQSPVGGLLNSGGGGMTSPRTAPPPPAHGMPGRVNAGRSSRPTGGGARYRDDRDPPAQDDQEVDESDTEANREIAEPMPVDPSQVPADRIIPEAGTIPGHAPLPGTDPYTVPPTPGGQYN